MAICARPLAESAERVMTQGHRAAHRFIWPVLAILVALGFTMALVLRPPPEQPEAPATETSK